MGWVDPGQSKLYGGKVAVAPQGYLWHIDIVHFAVGRQFCD